MILKYLLQVDNLTLGITYDFVNGNLEICGFTKHRDLMVKILEHYFDLDILNMNEHFLVSNKVIYKGKILDHSFVNGKNELEKQGITLNIVKSLGRLKR